LAVTAIATRRGQHDTQALTQSTRTAVPVVASESPFIEGYEAAAGYLARCGSSLRTPGALKSMCSKVHKGRRVDPYFPRPVVHGGNIVFDTRKLTAWARWKNGGPDPSTEYLQLEVIERRLELARREAERKAKRELEALLQILAHTDTDECPRISRSQLTILVAGFKNLLWEYKWDFESNTPAPDRQA
jgi:hypothetical protein